MPAATTPFTPFNRSATTASSVTATVGTVNHPTKNNTGGSAGDTNSSATALDGATATRARPLRMHSARPLRLRCGCGTTRPLPAPCAMSTSHLLCPADLCCLAPPRSSFVPAATTPFTPFNRSATTASSVTATPASNDAAGGKNATTASSGGDVYDGGGGGGGDAGLPSTTTAHMHATTANMLETASAANADAGPSLAATRTGTEPAETVMITTPHADSEGRVPGGPAGTAPPFECVNADEEPCFTGRQCFKSKHKCDGGPPDCDDGSDESTLACRRTGDEIDEESGEREPDTATAADGGKKDRGFVFGTAIWGIIGAVVGVGACGILAYLYVNGCSRKTNAASGGGGGAEAVKGFSLKFTNQAYDEGAADGELYGSASARPGGADDDQSYEDVDAPSANDHNYDEIPVPSINTVAPVRPLLAHTPRASSAGSACTGATGLPCVLEAWVSAGEEPRAPWFAGWPAQPGIGHVATA